MNMNADDLYRQIGRITVAHGNLHTFVEVLMSYLVMDMKAVEIILDGAPFSKWLDTLMKLVTLRVDKSTHKAFRKAISEANEYSTKRNEIVHDEWFIFNAAPLGVIARQPRRLSKRKTNPMEFANNKPNADELKEIEVGLRRAKDMLHNAFLDAIESTPALKVRALGPAKTPPVTSE